MVFDVESLNPEEILATKRVLETITCTHPVHACVDCPCFEICVFLRDIHDKCEDVLKAEIIKNSKIHKSEVFS